MLSIERIWEDDNFFQVEVKAKTDVISVQTRSYIMAAKINELAQGLINFPNNLDDRYLWENGERGDGSTACVALEFWCRDKAGHVLVEVYMELEDGGKYSKHNCCFYLETEIGLLNSFGKKLTLLNEKGIGKKVYLNELSNFS